VCVCPGIEAVARLIAEHDRARRGQSSRRQNRSIEESLSAKNTRISFHCYSHPEQYPLRQPVLETLERIKWYLCHGNVFQALKHIDDLEQDLDAAAFEGAAERPRKLLKAVEEFHSYV